jgi:serine/threonine-protein kinase HipA
MVLDVYLGDDLVAKLEQASPARVRLRYTPRGAALGFSLSVALPAREAPYEHEDCAPFFDGLLPEGAGLGVLTRVLGASRQNTFSLLRELGRDVGGAIAFLPEGERPSPAPHRMKALTPTQLGALIDELPTRPLGISLRDDVRLSLAGVQDKLVLCRTPDGGFALPVDGTPSTHILKPEIPKGDLDDTTINEAFCLAACRRAGLDVVDAELLDVDGRSTVVVRRYDREGTDGATRRLHQEDACQALAIPPAAKYEAEGGPGVGTVIGLLRRVTRPLAANVLTFLDQVVARYVLGDHDGHGKNVSILYLPTGLRLAPMYDLVSTAVYDGLSLKMAMRIGGEYRGDYIEERHWERLADDLDLGAAEFRRRRRRIGEAIVSAIADVQPEFATAGHGRPVVERIRAIAERRVQRL